VIYFFRPLQRVKASPTCKGASGSTDAMNVISRMLRDIVVNHVADAAMSSPRAAMSVRNQHFVLSLI
jgi:hypothetical protein